jgi:hypothetical protein
MNNVLIHEDDIHRYIDVGENFHYKCECSDESVKLTFKFADNSSVTGTFTEWFKGYKNIHPRVATTNDLYETIISAFEKCDGVTWDFVRSYPAHEPFYRLILWISDDGVSDTANFTTTLTLWDDNWISKHGKCTAIDT